MTVPYQSLPLFQTPLFPVLVYSTGDAITKEDPIVLILLTCAVNMVKDFPELNFEKI
ncbi:9448_t:CDS:2 [Funneliformis mosseae]|uniref:9448_t:CDS:1 n=1 Tax=Funneliformis mosseae TaxID=27381 RepID=A0A9N9EWT7_FUNMO|nr:9448_t:CDS:2 [Funneliformis mosseae]